MPGPTKSLLISASTIPLLQDVAALQKAKIQAEYLQTNKDGSDYKQKKPDLVGPRDAMRRKILALSLFPNVFNRRFVYKDEGPD
jgi:hypothetical protein